MALRNQHPKLHLDQNSHLCIAHCTESVYFTMRHHFFPLKIAPLRRGIWTLSNTWHLGLTQVHFQDSISIGSTVSVRLGIMTDRPRYSVCNNMLHVHSTATQPKNTARSVHPRVRRKKPMLPPIDALLRQVPWNRRIRNDGGNVIRGFGKRLPTRHVASPYKLQDDVTDGIDQRRPRVVLAAGQKRRV